MNAFRGLSNVAQATLAQVAPGIAEALIATAMGLFAAIPAVVAYNRYRARHRPAVDPLRELHGGVLQHPAAPGPTSRAMRCAARRRSMNQINVVPYIDVMLVLLVIFMVTAPLINPGQIDLPRSARRSSPPWRRWRCACAPTASLPLRDRARSGDGAQVKRAAAARDRRAAQQKRRIPSRRW